MFMITKMPKVPISPSHHALSMLWYQSIRGYWQEKWQGKGHSSYNMSRDFSTSSFPYFASETIHALASSCSHGLSCLSCNIQWSCGTRMSFAWLDILNIVYHWASCTMFATVTSMQTRSGWLYWWSSSQPIYPHMPLCPLTSVNWVAPKMIGKHLHTHMLSGREAGELQGTTALLPALSVTLDSMRKKLSNLHAANPDFWIPSLVDILLKFDIFSYLIWHGQ